MNPLTPTQIEVLRKMAKGHALLRIMDPRASRDWRWRWVFRNGDTVLAKTAEALEQCGFIEPREFNSHALWVITEKGQAFLSTLFKEAA